MVFNINNIGFRLERMSHLPTVSTTNRRNDTVVQCAQNILRQHEVPNAQQHLECLQKMQQAAAAKTKKHKQIKHASPRAKRKAHKVHTTAHKKIKKAHKSHKSAKKKKPKHVKQHTIHRVHKKSSKKLKKKSKKTHRAAHKALQKKHKKQQVAPAPVMPLFYPGDNVSYPAIPLVEEVAAGDERWTQFRTQYQRLAATLPVSLRTPIDQALSQGTSFAVVRQQCWDIVRTTIREQMAHFQGVNPPLSPVVRVLFPSYPEMISFTHQADELLQCARHLMQEPIGAPAQAYVTQTMHELSTSLSFDRIKEATSRFGKMLYLHDMGVTVPASASAIDQMTGELFRANIRSSIEMKHNSIAELVRARDQDAIPALYRERQLTVAVAKALVRPDGTVNYALIPALCDKLREYKGALGTFALQHMLNVLLEVRHDEKIHELLYDTGAPCDAFQAAVRVSMQLAPDGYVGRKESIITILSALLTPIRQMTGFGSCQTTAPLAVIRNASLRVAVRDLQEIVRTGKLTRQVLGDNVSYLAIPEVCPIINYETLVNPYNFLDSCPDKQFVQEPKHSLVADELSKGVLFLAYRELSQSRASLDLQQAECSDLMDLCLRQERHAREISYETILNFLIAHFHPNEAVTQAVRIRVHMSLQHPLLSAWENCLCGMHSSRSRHAWGKNDFLEVPLHSTAGAITWSDVYREAMKEFAERDLHDDKTPFTQTILQEDIRWRPLNHLRFAFRPPVKATDGGLWQAQLYYVNAQHEWFAITDVATMQRRMKEVFQSITGKVLTDVQAQQLQGRLRTKLTEQQLPEEACWRFCTLPRTFSSKMYNIYFDEDASSKDIFTTDIRAGVQAFRQFAIEKKNAYGNVKNMRLKGHANLQRGSAHAFQIRFSEAFFAAPEKQSLQWIQDKESYLRSIKAAQVSKVVEAVCQKIVEDHLYAVSKKERQAFKLHMQQKTNLSFFDWCHELGVTLQRYKTRGKSHKSVSASDVEKIEQEIINLINVHYPKLYRQCVLSFANTNYSVVDAKEGALVPEYFSFSFTPSLRGPAAWKTLQISKRCRSNKERSIQAEKINNLNIKESLGPVFEAFKEREKLLQYARHEKILERHLRAFCAAWEEVSRERGVPGVSRAKKRMLFAQRRYHKQVEQAKTEKLYLAPEMVLARADTFPREALQALLGTNVPM